MHYEISIFSEADDEQRLGEKRKVVVRDAWSNGAKDSRPSFGGSSDGRWQIDMEEGLS